MKHKNSQIFQAIKLKHMGFTPTQISEELRVSRTTINHWLTKAQLKDVKWEDIRENSADELVKLLFGQREVNNWLRVPNWLAVATKMTEPGQTLKQCHQDYLNSFPQGSGLSYSSFCEGYSKFVKENPSKTKSLTIHQTYRPGQALLIDYSGDGLTVLEKADGQEIKEVRKQLFVACMGFSGYVVAVLTPRQTRKDWLYAIDKSFEILGKVPEEIVLDNSTSLVLKADKFDAELCKELKEFCDHYEVSAHAVAPGRPTFKAGVERSVGIIQQEIKKRLLHLPPLTAQGAEVLLGEVCKDINSRKLSELYETSREERFRMELAYMHKLPAIRYSTGKIIGRFKVSKEDQVRIKGLRYNVEYGNAGEYTDVVFFEKDNEFAFFLHKSGREIGRSKCRRHVDGHEPSDPNKVAPEIRYLAEGRDELIKDLGTRYGQNVEEMCRKIAKKNNSNSVTHLRGIFSYGQKAKDNASELMDRTARLLLSQPELPTFQLFRNTFERLARDQGLELIGRSTKKRISAATQLEFEEISNVRGAAHYAKQGAARAKGIKGTK